MQFVASVVVPAAIFSRQLGGMIEEIEKRGGREENVFRYSGSESRWTFLAFAADCSGAPADGVLLAAIVTKHL